MLVLDTNIISEFMTSPPDSNVQSWLNAQNPNTLYLSVITIAEIRYGLERMPKGKRRKSLAQSFDKFVSTAFEGRVLPFDIDAAQIYGDLMALREGKGRPMAALDCQIASIVLSKKYSVVTRNVKDFEGCGLELVNPFKGN